MEMLHCRYLYLGVFFSERICIPAFATTQILHWLTADGQACVFSNLLYSPLMPEPPHSCPCVTTAGRQDTASFH